jgi:NTE family protein
MEMGHIPLFEGLETSAWEEIRARLQRRQFARGELVCRQGDPASSLFIVESGLLQVSVSGPHGPQNIARLRKGDVVGEMSPMTGEPRSATVEAILPTSAFEVDQQGFASILAAHPQVMSNLGRILSRRLSQADAHLSSRRHGEAVALVAGSDASWLMAQVVAMTQAASTRGVLCLDLTGTLPAENCQHLRDAEAVIERLEAALREYATVLVVASLTQPLALLEQMDRVLLLGNEDECGAVAGLCRGNTEVVLLKRTRKPLPDAVAGLKVIRTVDLDAPEDDVAWLGRQLARTRIGVAFGAGGAKGFAHVGALRALDAAGYTLDFVGGSSIGATVAACLALGKDAEQIDAALRGAFTPENVAAIFKLSFGGLGTGNDLLQRIFQEITDGLSFGAAMMPLTIMSVDLQAKRPVALTDGPIWQALMAASAVPGLYPPYQMDSQRLVDAIALVPVPTEAVRAAGADVVVSVNLISRETLPAWPAGIEVPVSVPVKSTRVLDTLLETMELMQLDCSCRHAALADVVVAPRFGPGTWRDFHLADLFLAAGQLAMEQQLPALRALANPQPCLTRHSGGMYGRTSVHV